MNPILNKIELSKYLNKKHLDEYGVQISPVKLQKSLYFLFAYWSKNSSAIQNQLSEVDNCLSIRLFESNFRAWAYGPVDQQVYGLFKNNKLQPMSSDELIEWEEKQDSTVIDFINDQIKDYFSTSDFGLVDISHTDKCWENNFNPLVERSNNPIPEQEIIDEYKVL